MDGRCGLSMFTLLLLRFRRASATQSMHLHTYRWLQIAVQ
jgi:hypothetical protein